MLSAISQCPYGNCYRTHESTAQSGKYYTHRYRNRFTETQHTIKPNRHTAYRVYIKNVLRSVCCYSGILTRIQTRTCIYDDFNVCLCGVFVFTVNLQTSTFVTFTFTFTKAIYDNNKNSFNHYAYRFNSNIFFFLSLPCFQ